MRFTVIGGGPAGLGAAISVKRALGPRAEVTVHDRRDPGQDGFGLILSPRTVARYAALGFAWAQEVAGSTASWGGLAVLSAREPVTVAGHPARAVARSLLVGAMRREARSLGCALVDGAEADEADFPDADGVVDARGARHRAFTLAEVEAGTEEVHHVWYATDRRFPCLTFVLVETGAGVLTAHTYPYGPDRSAFIVEGPASAWRAVLGGRRGPDDGARLRAAVRSAFAEVLAGHELLGAATRLRSFRTRTAPRWRTGRRVLIGDAAHSAHFSVGSGTTMALDDALSLAEHLRDAPDVATGMDGYAAVRRPETGRVQALGRRSAAWWASLPARWSELSEAELAWSLVTRTGQGTTSRLRVDNPSLHDELVARARKRPVAGAGGARAVRYPEDPGAAAALAAPGPVEVLVDRLDAATRVGLVDLLERTAEHDVLRGRRSVALRVRPGDRDWAEAQLLAGRVSAVGTGAP
ncbi:FAD-dependent monooxygenase [Saccharothrix algeriensis]|uniref:2-polyprenyl-6-methoxyphenol hydroxylase-like FAD-dependent oxidoreductase n=1 Tax=Saccharothrix algeriensis TaxID=173560 RepID=A0ABS2S239_9PSEU|nr:FAD-dependent monooxygenase [Saccharothrix algeriensis]MBM7810305.1 2-polyprenyl-6-methoxyphenol hydroxylase-like FAD-dependent oxidoreductase [Saccharothrix algeriensis]